MSMPSQKLGYHWRLDSRYASCPINLAAVNDHAYSRTPVRCVSWCEAIAFANLKSTSERLDPVYKFVENGETPKHDIDCNEGAQFVEMKHDANGWRLPTEAEWEIASGTSSMTTLTERAWFETNSNNQPHPVARKQPNELGLYDMHGNMHEWIWERFGEFEFVP